MYIKSISSRLYKINQKSFQIEKNNSKLHLDISGNCLEGNIQKKMKIKNNYQFFYFKILFMFNRIRTI